MKMLNRRKFLKSTVAAFAGTMGVLSLGMPRHAAAAEWPRDAYGAKTVDDALKNLFGTGTMTNSTEVKIKAPLQAENGSVVPVAVSTNLPDVQSISILVEKNPAPLAAHLNLSSAAVPYFAANIKMGSTSDVYFIVKAGGKLYSAKQTIKVTVGGCGG